MTAPGIIFTRADGQTGARGASPIGTLAIIATSEKGPPNALAAYGDPNAVLNTYGRGRLSEYAAYVIGASRQPVVVGSVTASAAGTYSALSISSSPGTSAITKGSSSPFDDFSVVVKFITGGTVGTTGITYQTSTNGGSSFGPTQSLGTATTLAIPDAGASLALGTGTVVAGQTVTFTTTAPALALTDLTAVLEALRVTTLQYEAVLIDAVADAALISGLSTWLNNLEAKGKYRRVFINARFMNQGETVSAYQTAMSAIRAAASDVRINVGADGGFITGAVSKVPQLRPVSLLYAARVMNNPLGKDAAAVADGPLTGVSILDSNGAPIRRDESATPGLDDLKFATLRTFEGRSGTFLTNPNVFSPDGSDYVYDQHTRCMNRAIELAYNALLLELSRDLRKDPTRTGPNGEVYVAESELRSIEQAVQLAVLSEVGSAVSALRFTLSRNDDVGANSGATLTGFLELESLAYVKKFGVTARFSRQITASAA